jgi:glycosyltransferase involved in cell wall biosynthesis
MDLVSVIIPSYNRFNFLLNAIHSIKAQTYKNIEIIVINDCSTEKEYYDYDWNQLNISIIHLKENTKLKYNGIYTSTSCIGFVRNEGIKISNGKYIAFCDDDDIWFPEKINLQLDAMKNTGCKMSSTDGLIGNGIYNPNLIYKIYNQDANFSTIQNIYKNKASNLMDYGFPKIWNLEFLLIHNCIITSSLLIHKDILDIIGNFRNVSNISEDYDCWLRALQHTNLVYINDICFYYDMNHGYGINY